MISMGLEPEFTPTGAMPSIDNGIMICGACFDVKKEDADLEEGHKGIGYCVYEQNDITYADANLFGTIEAQGSDSF